MAYIRYRKDRKCWQAEIKHPSGKKVSKTDKLKSVVKKWAEEQERAIEATAGVYDPSAGKTTFETFYTTRFLPQRAVSKATQKKDQAFGRRILNEWGTWPLNAIKKGDVGAWVKRMSQGKKRDRVGPHALAESLSLFRIVLELAVDEGLLIANPAASVKAPPKPKHLDRELSETDRDRIIAEMPTLGDRVLARFLARTGVRWAEAAGMPEALIDLDRRVARVRWVLERDGTFKELPKSDAGNRVVPLPDDLVFELRRWFSERPDTAVGHPAGGRVAFCGVRGAPVDYTNWLPRKWNVAVRRAGLDDPKPTPHDLRHAYATDLAAAGMPQVQIAALLGHESTKSSERYLHATDGRLEQARQILARSAPADRSEAESAQSPHTSSPNTRRAGFQ